MGQENYNFLEQEFKEWIDPNTCNPGRAWEKDPQTWSPFMREDGTFQYTYNQRFFLKDPDSSPICVDLMSRSQFQLVVDLLNKDPYSRQAFVGIWSPYHDLEKTVGQGPCSRVPCTIGYHFFLRDAPEGSDKKFNLEMVYIMRSLNISWNLWNDLWLVTNLFDWMVKQLDLSGLSVGNGSICFQVGSLHIIS